jgi:hypothetical protein
LLSRGARNCLPDTFEVLVNVVIRKSQNANPERADRLVSNAVGILPARMVMDFTVELDGKFDIRREKLTVYGPTPNWRRNLQPSSFRPWSFAHNMTSALGIVARKWRRFALVRSWLNLSVIGIIALRAAMLRGR